MVLLTILFIIVLLFVVLKLWVKLTTGMCKSPVCLVGKTVIVTGGNTGIGYETALDMTMRGAKVILACRNKDKAVEAKDKIIRETGNPNVTIRIIDMASFASVRNFAKEINETENQLDILINNAGAGGLKSSKTEDGCELMVQTNYYSPVLLTLLLIDLLKKTPNSRIVNVSSLAGSWAKINVENPDEYSDYNTTYSNTKLFNILFTIELAKKLKNTSVTTYSLHPGVIYTEFLSNFEPAILRETAGMFIKLFFKNPREGAQTTIYCAVQKGIESLSGEHFSDCVKISPYKTVKDDDVTKLWKKTMQIIKESPKI